MLKKLAILCSDGAHHNYMVGLLQAHFNVAVVIREPERQQRARARRERRWIDSFYMEYHHRRRIILGLDSYRKAYYRDIHDVDHEHRCLQVTVDYICAPSVSDLLQSAKPDLTVVMGTSILKGHVLSAAGPHVINIHGGYLPDYRGNHCFFFAMYHRRFDRIGSTIHFLNAGIDTGDIIEVVVPRIGPEDNAEMLYCRAEKRAIHRVSELIHAVQDGGEFKRTPQPFRGHLYRTRDRKLWHDLHHWIRCLTGSHQRALAEWNVPATVPESLDFSR